MTRKQNPTISGDSSEDPLIGKQLGDYRLTSILATGGMARIYKGMDVKLQRQAAVKVLPQEDVAGDKTLAKRFQREARAVAALEHDNIITLYQYGEQEGVYFLAMKLVKGKDLSQELKKFRKSGKKMDIGRALRILEQVASALDAAHAAGVVHRDIKPSNILLDDDKAILTDFGLVLRTSAETTMGTAFGTPRYIAPEQAVSSNKAVPQSDIYALGVILFEILTGETPFNGESPMEIALSHISDPPPNPRSLDASIPQAVEREILKALSKEPEKRHSTASALIKAVKKAYGLNTDTTGSMASMSSVSEAPAVSPAASAKGSATLGNMSTPILRKAKAEPSEVSTTPASGKSRTRLLLIVVLLVIVGAAATFFVLTGGGKAKVVLTYDDASFTIRNSGGYTINVQALLFVRGADGKGRDSYSGDRVSGDVLKPESCARVIWLNKKSVVPSDCQDVVGEEGLNEIGLFWRTETDNKGGTAPTFEVQYKGETLTRCETVASGGKAKECSFNWPLGAFTPTPGK